MKGLLTSLGLIFWPFTGLWIIASDRVAVGRGTPAPANNIDLWALVPIALGIIDIGVSMYLWLARHMSPWWLVASAVVYIVLLMIGFLIVMSAADDDSTKRRYALEDR